MGIFLSLIPHSFLWGTPYLIGTVLFSYYERSLLICHTMQEISILSRVARKIHTFSDVRYEDYQRELWIVRQNFSFYIFFSLRIKKKNKVSGGKTHFAHTYLSLSSQVANKSMQELFPFARFLNNTLPIYVEERTSITRQNILLTTKIFRSACMLSAHSKYQKIQGLLLCRKLSSLCFKLHVAMKIVLPNHQIPFLFLASY